MRPRPPRRQFAEPANEGTMRLLAAIAVPRNFRHRRQWHPQRLLQLDNPLARARLHRNHRHAQFLGKFRHIQTQASLLGDIDHVQRDNHWQTQLDHLHRQAQMPLKVRSIHHTHHHIRLAHPRQLTTQGLHRNPLIRRSRLQRITTGQIHDPHLPPVRREKFARLHVDGHAREISNPLVRAGQRIENGRLARVGIPHQRHHRHSFGLLIHADRKINGSAPPPPDRQARG